jgi:hypothetical protein
MPPMDGQARRQPNALQPAVDCGPVFTHPLGKQAVSHKSRTGHPALGLSRPVSPFQGG